MEGKILLFKLILLIERSSAPFCDMDTSVQVQPGNLGQVSDFNWLGVLHINLHDGRVVVSGIVLIKEKYALVNADDVGKIPEDIFKTDSRAIFLLGPNTPWYARPASYITHPEYGHSTVTSIALIELILNKEMKHPIRPICYPMDDESIAYEHLYLTGLTNKNRMLEKVIYKIQYVDNKLCEKYYVSKLTSRTFMPSAYVCGYVPNLEEQCVWDIGMALVSNSTGYFSLIGFSVGDPSCSAPARFINMFQYFQWIDTVICPDQHYVSEDCGRRKYADIESIPIYKLFNRRKMEKKHRKGSTLAPLKYYVVVGTDDDKSISIAAYNASLDDNDKACTSDMVSVRKENFELKATMPRGIVTYKLSLYDMIPGVRSCVRVTVDCDDQSGVIVKIKEGIPPTTLSSAILNIDMKHKDRITRDTHHVQEKLSDSDLYITIEFMNKATLTFEMLAVPTESSTVASRRVTPKFSQPSTRTNLTSFWGMDPGADY